MELKDVLNVALFVVGVLCLVASLCFGFAAAEKIVEIVAKRYYRRKKKKADKGKYYEVTQKCDTSHKPSEVWKEWGIFGGANDGLLKCRRIEPLSTKQGEPIKFTTTVKFTTDSDNDAEDEEDELPPDNFLNQQQPYYMKNLTEELKKRFPDPTVKNFAAKCGEKAAETTSNIWRDNAICSHSDDIKEIKELPTIKREILEKKIKAKFDLIAAISEEIDELKGEVDSVNGETEKDA